MLSYEGTIFSKYFYRQSEKRNCQFVPKLFCPDNGYQHCFHRNLPARNSICRRNSFLFKYSFLLHSLDITSQSLSIILSKFYQRFFRSFPQSPGFLTIVAGTNVLGSQFIIIQQNYHIAALLYYVGLILWAILIYSFFIMITVKRGKPSLEEGMNGIWLLMVVATQSISILGTQLVAHLPFPKEVILFLSLALFLVGCMLYIIIITLIFYRLTFFELRAEETCTPILD